MSRFTRVADEIVMGSKVLCRSDVMPGSEARSPASEAPSPASEARSPASEALSPASEARSPASEARSPGAFLGRLWALFGPASPIDGGFRYALRDEESGLCFSAYSGASGPSYGAAVPAERLLPVARALEALLAATPPADCSLEVPREIEYGGGTSRIGVRGGAPFEEAVKEARRPARGARSYEDCVRLAKEAGKGGYGMTVGWHVRLERALPEPPDSFELDGRCYENCVGFVLTEKGAPAFAFDEGDGLEEIPVERIPWPRPLSASAKLWLESYAAWRKTRKK